MPGRPVCDADRRQSEPGAGDADTWTAGFTLTPWQNFSSSVDFYQIKIKGEIGTIPLNTSYQQCLTTGNPTYCSLIVRSATGGLFGTTIAGGGYIVGTNINTANVKAQGIDVQLSYRCRSPMAT